jgi:ferredoxin, 2Fe-2S
MMVTFIDGSGQHYVAEAQPGQTLMQVALDHAVPGVLAECGGSCSCGTCHIYLDESANQKFPPPTESESFLLEIVIDPNKHSRLACQLKLPANLGELTVRLPKEQL